MADEINRENESCRQLYNDTMYFVDAMVTDYDFYHKVLDMVKDGDTEIALRKKTVKKNVDENWVRAIEDSLFALDHVVRNPARYIKEVEEVVPIERARNINSKSIQHLSRHSDYISKIDGDEITPSKILNVYRDETLDVYENKFINTLIKRLYDFLEKRYPHICGGGSQELVTEVTVKTEFKDGERHGTFNFGIETSDPIKETNTDGTASDVPTLVERVDKLMGVVRSYMHTELVQTLGKSYIRPPVMHTNAILKNKNLRQCLDLWEFIESYDKIGYEIDVQEKLEKPNEKFVTDLYSMLGLQYVIFRYNINKEGNLIIGEHDDDNPIMPRFATEYDPYDADDFTVFDSEYKKCVPYSELSLRRHLSPDEMSVRRALEDAFVADVAFSAGNPVAEIERSLEEAEQARRELARIKAESAKAAKEKAKREAEEAERAEAAARAEAEEKARLEAEIASQEQAKENAVAVQPDIVVIQSEPEDVPDEITEEESVPVIPEIPVIEDIAEPETASDNEAEKEREATVPEAEAPEEDVQTPAEAVETEMEKAESEFDEDIRIEEKASESAENENLAEKLIRQEIFEAEAEQVAREAEEARRRAEEKEKYLKAGRKRKKKLKKEAEMKGMTSAPKNKK